MQVPIAGLLSLSGDGLRGTYQVLQAQNPLRDLGQFTRPPGLVGIGDGTRLDRNVANAARCADRTESPSGRGIGNDVITSACAAVSQMRDCVNPRTGAGLFASQNNSYTSICNCCTATTPSSKSRRTNTVGKLVCCRNPSSIER